MATPSDLIRGSELPRHEAERLLVTATGMSRADLAVADQVVGDALARFHDLVAERRRGVPLQYLERSVQFGPLELATDSRALIPRPETERLWELVVAEMRDDEPAVIVDLCTGSGNLALALKHTFPAAAVYGTDISSEAISLARTNALLTGLDVSWLQGDLFAALPAHLRERIDVIVSNPPYIAAADFDSLPVEVRAHEPLGALIAGRRGDEVLARIAAEAGEWLRRGGLIACEIGADQGEPVAEMFVHYSPEIRRDLAGRDRYVFGRPGRD